MAYLKDESFEHWHESELYIKVQFGPRRKHSVSGTKRNKVQKKTAGFF